jgi:hypothetical protein
LGENANVRLAGGTSDPFFFTEKTTDSPAVSVTDDGLMVKPLFWALVITAEWAIRRRQSMTIPFFLKESLRKIVVRTATTIKKIRSRFVKTSFQYPSLEK